ncbi:helix-turn-helix domain-containing protein [Endozoicomonas sp.]|uniref:helix-turn-helix domain-containing protein n=1 Tax=Endozoicomonas sp. TaxID=1892382 RepID=UPI002888B85E|nr:helix-turn-helix domain-containing protein [Endozoicomonas sp.]
MDWLSAVQLFVLSQGLLLLVIMLTVRSETPSANKLLAMFIGINTLGIALHLAVRTEATVYQPLYQPFYIVYLLMIMKGPLIYLYVRSLTEHQFAFTKPLLIHALCLLPGLIAWFAIAPDEPSSSGNHTSAVDHAISVFYLLNSLILFAYGVAALRLLRSHQDRLKKTFSSLGPITLGWLKWLILYIITLRLAYIGTGVLLTMGMINQQPSIFLLLDFGVIYFIAIGGLRQPRIFTGGIQEVLEKLEQPAPPMEKTAQNKYERSALDDHEINRIWQKLVDCFEQDLTYMREDLNLSQLAELLEVTSHELSQVINLRSGGNFYELVNRYRIEKAKKLLSDPVNRQRKLLDIAMEVGYKSQSTFYSQFSKHSGTTPRKYRETQCFK